MRTIYFSVVVGARTIRGCGLIGDTVYYFAHVVIVHTLCACITIAFDGRGARSIRGRELFFLSMSLVRVLIEGAVYSGHAV